MDSQSLNTIALELRRIADALSKPQTPSLGFGVAPRAQIYVFCNRKHGGVWYSLNPQNQPEIIESPALTGYIRKLEFKQVERRKEETYKLHCMVEADKIYVLESGSKAHFTKGLLSAIASLTPEELQKPLTLYPQPSTENAEVLFCNVYQSDRQIFAPYDDETDWRAVAATAREKVAAANSL
jgi:hypothetical protein